MSGLPILDLDQLRRGCAYCSLKELCLPAGISGAELKQLDDLVRRRRSVARGERIFRPGDSLVALYVPREGAFKSVSLSEDGEAQVLGFHLPGELIGLDALGSGTHRCEGVALTPSTVCEVPFEGLSSIAAQVPGLQRQLLRVIGQSVGRDNEHAGMLVRRHAHERIAAFLHALGERMARIGESGSVMRLPMSRDEIAGFLGLAIETVSRGFTRLQELGLIAVLGRRVEILKRDALHELAQGAVSGGELRRTA